MVDTELGRMCRAAGRERRQAGGRRRGIVAALAVLLAVLAAVSPGGVGYALAREPAPTAAAAPGGQQREFMFEVLGVATPNQGGQRLNLFFTYRYNRGIAERDIPDYLKLRATALAFLETADLSQNPYWETLNHELCSRLKNGYPLEAISCQMQVAGNEDPNHYEPGYHSSVETIGDISPLRIPGPPAPATP